MFTRNKIEDQNLDAAINELYSQLDGLTGDTDEYAKTLDQLTKLYALKANPSRVSADTLANIAANLTGILIVVGYEQKHVITTKALGFIAKLK